MDLIVELKFKISERKEVEREGERKEDRECEEGNGREGGRLSESERKEVESGGGRKWREIEEGRSRVLTSKR